MFSNVPAATVSSTSIVSSNIPIALSGATFAIDRYMSIIRDTPYIQNCKQNKKKDIHSITYLIDRKLAKKMSHSDCIKLGHGIEHFFRNIVKTGAPNLRNIKSRTKKGEKEMDHLFEDPEKKIIYYAELKSSLNLDTEKRETTYMKCLENEKKLRELFPEHTINMFLVGNRYLERRQIETYKKIMDKYSPISKNLCGVNDYFCKLGIPHMCFEDETQYCAVLNTIVQEMFKYSSGSVDDDASVATNDDSTCCDDDDDDDVSISTL